MEKLIISNKDVSKFDEVAVLLAVNEGEEFHATTVYESMIELKELVQAAGSETKAELVLNQKIDPDYYVDKENLEYVAKHAQELEIYMIVTIDSLSGNQIKNMEEVTGLKVVDRTILLLDIFSQSSSRREGKLEIEKAQLKYRSTRIEGFQGKYKYGSGIGVFSPSKKRLLTDLNEINERIDSIKTDLSVIVKNRFVQRSRKTDVKAPLVAFAGYTNCGKSTIMNKLIELGPDHTKESEVIVKDHMLSTLDVSLRKSMLPNGKDFMIVDTIGFVSDLPGIIREAFRSTFEEVSYADLILVVYDASRDDLEAQKSIMDFTFEKIGVSNKRKIEVYNKADKLDPIPESSDNKIYVSAKSGYNLDKLIEAIQFNLFEDNQDASLLIPYSRFDIFNEIKKNRVIEMDDFKHTDFGIELNIVLSKDEFEKYKLFIK